MSHLPRRDVFSVGVSLCSLEDVTELILSPPEAGQVIAIGNVHSIMTARRSSDLAEALAAANVVTPDGMPLVWALKIGGDEEATRVTGIDVMSESLARGVELEKRHFFYGSTPQVLDAMIRKVQEDYPGVRVAGAISPPFREISEEEQQGYFDDIKSSGADVVWVGLGMPKQELWMHGATKELPSLSLVGVGAAFDWYAGTAPRAPRWMQNTGLEWLYRLIHEPRRLWRRYAFNNPAFLFLLGRRWVRTLRDRARRAD